MVVARWRVWWRDFLDMAVAVAHAWWTLAVPIVAGGAITAYDRFRGAAVDLRTLEWPLIIAFVLAFFIAWSRRQRVLEAAQRDLIKAQRDLAESAISKEPKLFAYIKLIAKIRAKGLEQPALFAHMEIRNDGFRSVVKDFCPVVVANGHKHFGRLAKTGEVSRMTNKKGQREAIYERDAIYNTTKSPIEPGDVRAGHLFFYFDKSVGDFDKHSVRIMFRDYRNTPFITEPIDPDDTQDTKTLPNVAGMFSMEQFESASDE